MSNEFEYLKITTTKGVIVQELKFRRDLEVANWHYYENTSGKLVHIRKEHMVSVEELLEGDFEIELERLESEYE